jgi:hypothetical protein
MRTFTLLVVVISCLFIGLSFAQQQTGAAPAVQQNPSNIGFEWAFGVLQIKGDEEHLVRITRDTTLKSGDEIKLFVKLTKDCFVYVLHQGPSGEIDLLFPYNIQQFQKDYVTEKNYYIPKGREWLKLDKSVGKEVFFILASTERLLDIEAKVGNYISADAASKKTLGDSLVSEIRSVRKRYSTFATIAEKPIAIGGNIRDLIGEVKSGRHPDVANIATEIKANNFFSKTITIDHQ